MKKKLAGLSVLLAVMMLVLLVAVVGAAPSAPPERVVFTKTTSNAEPRLGDIFTFTLRFSTTSTETSPINVRVADPNPAPTYLHILTPTIKGGASYSPTINGVVWEGMLEPQGESLKEVTFQVRVTGIPVSALAGGYLVTNTATMVDLASPGSLPQTKAEARIRIMPLRLWLPIVCRNK